MLFLDLKYLSSAVLVMAFGWTWPGRVEKCTALSVVEGQGTEVNKTVSIPGLGLVAKNNWNTDWVVSSHEKFQSFQATIVSEDDSSYRIEMYLKYGDQTADQFYQKKEVKLIANEPLTIEATTRTKTQPYQVNLLVGGIEAVGKTYTASVVGCS
ncbi:conserved hypothetical protein [Hyella patelloides LEGE 07179]|uniref:Uncharacterized protein n=1 Tax=Hyella patelloides LEGE 07179 TaxID=945734 RepID=A0A563VZI2_9CYAN|nr:hypothetical protein [Hyella patelloides]VEP16673.1 conserved hypothetical protein [Hyella patelloides LEGE 07179]